MQVENKIIESPQLSWSRFRTLLYIGFTGKIHDLLSQEQQANYKSTTSQLSYRSLRPSFLLHHNCQLVEEDSIAELRRVYVVWWYPLQGLFPLRGKIHVIPTANNTLHLF